jgi:hypothetical protein
MSDICAFARNREEVAKRADRKRSGKFAWQGQVRWYGFQGSGVDRYIGWNFHPTNNTRYISIRGGMSGYVFYVRDRLPMYLLVNMIYLGRAA